MLASKEKADHRQGRGLDLLSHRSCDRRLPNPCQPIHPVDRLGNFHNWRLYPLHYTAQYLLPSSFKAAVGCTETIRIVASIGGTRKNLMEELNLLVLRNW